jgi:uncharacterized damage-inducible protein DinB
MTKARDVLTDVVTRVREGVSATVGDLDEDRLAHRPGPDANSIGWLLWHLTRVEDAHVAEFLGTDQLYVVGGHAAALGFPEDPSDHGYGHTSEQVAAVRISDPAVLVAYHEAVADRTLEYLSTQSGKALDRVVDEHWDPPVTAAVRWVSIVEDCMMHLGPAQYVAGLLPDR